MKSLDRGRRLDMFRSSSPFSLTDLDMWDTRSRFAAQTSAWCGMAAVSGTGFLSKVSTSSCGSASGLRQNDPGLQRWQSLSHLEPKAGTYSFHSSPGAELRAARSECGFRQAEVGQWIQDVHECQFNSLRNRNSPLSYNKIAAHLDMKHQEKESAEFSQFKISRQRGELQEKAMQLEKELLQLKSSMGKGGSDQTTEKTHMESHGKTCASSQEDLNMPESQKVDSELHKLREALKEAEMRAKTQEEERKWALQKLQTSIEIQSTLLNQIEKMNQRLSNTRQNQSEVQEQLSEANNKISQACLEKATLLTQVMKLEDSIKVLISKQAEDQTEKEKLSKEKADLNQRNQVLDLLLKRDQKGPKRSEDSKPSTNKEDEEKAQMREKLKVLEEVNKKLTHELEMTKQKLITSQSELQEMTAEKDVLSKQVTELKTESIQLVREKDKLLCIVSEGGHEKLTEVEKKCSQLRESVEALQSEKLKLQDQCLCLEAKVLEKEEKLQQQVEEFKRQDALRVQAFEEQKAVASHWNDKWQKVALTLQATQKELDELKKDVQRKQNESDSRPRVQLNASKEEPGKSRVQVQPDGHKGPEALQTEDAAESVTDLSESSSILDKPSDSHTIQNKTVQVKGEEPSVESKKPAFQVSPEADQQRKLVTEQLKSLFRERGGKEAQTVDNSSAGAQTGAPSPPQDRSQKAMRKGGERRIWQYGSGLMPVFEEDEEACDCSRKEEGELVKLSSEMFDHTMGAGIINQKAENENLLRAALICKHQTADQLSGASCDAIVLNIPNYPTESSIQKMRPPPVLPDGIFLAKCVDICSPDEDEDEEDLTSNTFS